MDNGIIYGCGLYKIKKQLEVNTNKMWYSVFYIIFDCFSSSMSRMISTYMMLGNCSIAEQEFVSITKTRYNDQLNELQFTK